MRCGGQDVTGAELAVLEVLWDKGSCCRRQIVDILYPGGGATEYATVQKLLERLEKKGCVRRSEGETGLTFTAAIERGELIARRLLEVADQLCGGSMTPLLMNLVRARPLSEREVGELEDYLAGLKRQARQKGNPR